MEVAIHAKQVVAATVKNNSIEAAPEPTRVPFLTSVIAINGARAVIVNNNVSGSFSSQIFYTVVSNNAVITDNEVSRG